jgi:TPR repeat protein
VKNDPVLQSNIGWLSSNCDSFDVSGAEKAKWTKKAAEAGYPIAQSNYGMKLIRGEDVRKNIAKGVVMMNTAIEGGYANAAALLSIQFSDAKHMPRKLREAKIYLDIAKSRGADARFIKSAEDAYAENGGPAQKAESAALVDKLGCFVSIIHACRVSENTEGSWYNDDLIAARTDRTIGFKRCGYATASTVTLMDGKIQRTDENSDILKVQMQRLERLARDFRQKAMAEFPNCNRKTRTTVRLFTKQQTLKSFENGKLLLRNANLRDSYRINY